MATRWTLTIDCDQPGMLARFWAEALGYVESPPPEGWDTWEAWLADQGVPEAEWDDGAALADPDGIGPSLSFLRVPEPKTAKNRMHVDIQIGGGRATPWEQRWPRVQAEKERLIALGATVVAECEQNGRPDHFVMTDPEGNEFCLV
jgi:glyoxalase superfamily protein